MSAETALYSALSGSAPVTALVSTRIYPDLSPQDVGLPAIAFGRTDTEYVNTIHGTALATRVTLEVWSMADKRSQAEAVADAVETAVRAATFVTLSRRAEYDESGDFRATVITVDYWS